MAIIKRKTIPFNFSEKHKEYMRRTAECMYNIAEGAIRVWKTVDNAFSFAHELKTAKDKLHLATGSTVANANFDDSLIVDSKTENQLMMQEATSGLIRKDIYLMRRYGVTEDQAKEMLPQTVITSEEE